MRNCLVAQTALFLAMVNPALSFQPNPTPEQIKRFEQLRPWMERAKYDLRNKAGLDQILGAIGKKTVVCIFNLGSDGKPADLKVVRSSGIRIVDESVSSFVLKQCSFNMPPPNQLPYEHGLAVIFSNNSTDPEPGRLQVVLQSKDKWYLRMLR